MTSPDAQALSAAVPFEAVVVTGAVVASILVALLLARRAAAGNPIVTGVPWPAAGWDGFLLLFVISLFFLTAGACAAAVGSGATVTVKLAASAFATLLVTLVVVMMLRAARVPWRSIGLGSFDPSGDLCLALGGLVLVTGPLLLVAGALDRIVPYEHPVVDSIGGERDAAGVAIVVIAAVLAAPVFEELFFRRLLLGWIDTVAPSPGGAVAILVSALLFGLAHWGQGLAWIPLVILGAVLGALARTRGSLVPAILLHALFNATSVALLVVGGRGA